MGRIHLEAALSMGWSCAAAVDPHPSGEAMVALPEGTPLFGEYGTEISTLKPDVVVLATTTDVRAQLLLRILEEESVKFVVTEKPLSVSIAHARAVFASAESRQKSVVVNHQMRFTPTYRYIADLVFSRRYGELISIYVSGSNFGLGNNVVHFIEIALYLFDSDPLDVRGQIEETPLSSHRGEQFKDYSGRLEANFSNSRTLCVEFMNSLGHGVLTVLNFSFAKIVVNELSGEVTVLARRDEDFAASTQRYGLEGRTESHHFGAVDLVAGTTSLYKASQMQDNATADLRRAVLAVEISTLALYSARENGSLPVAYEVAGSTKLTGINHSWA